MPRLIGITDPGWQIIRRAAFDNITAGKAAGLRGQHGWDPQLMSMRGVFIAAGPAFRRDADVKPFENVSIYNVLARVLGVTPPPNDGDRSVMTSVLRN
ncbi:MAG: hypothetical protein DMF88_19035 [Acidobacteria bacterium]|nr:MAG: hypothetical protein DMF88_19035 [Acidobacteriota bacterium]